MNGTASWACRRISRTIIRIKKINNLWNHIIRNLCNLRNLWFQMFLSVLGSVLPEHCIEILPRMQWPILHFANRWSAINLNFDLVLFTKVYLYPHFCPGTVGCNSPLKKGDSGGCVFSGYSPFSRGQVYNPLDPPFPKWDFYAPSASLRWRWNLVKPYYDAKNSLTSHFILTINKPSL